MGAVKRGDEDMAARYYSCATAEAGAKLSFKQPRIALHSGGVHTGVGYFFSTTATPENSFPRHTPPPPRPPPLQSHPSGPQKILFQSKKNFPGWRWEENIFLKKFLSPVTPLNSFRVEGDALGTWPYRLEPVSRVRGIPQS